MIPATPLLIENPLLLRLLLKLGEQLVLLGLELLDDLVLLLFVLFRFERLRDVRPQRLYQIVHVLF